MSVLAAMFFLGCHLHVNGHQPFEVVNAPPDLLTDLLSRGVQVSEHCGEVSVPDPTSEEDVWAHQSPIFPCARVTGMVPDVKGAALLNLQGSNGPVIGCDAHHSWTEITDQFPSSVTMEGPLWLVEYPPQDPNVLRAVPSGGRALMMHPCHIVSFDAAAR